MPRLFSPGALAARVQQLVAERKRHLDALAKTEPALKEIEAALGITTVAAPRPAATAAPAAKPRRKTRRGRFTITGRDSIVAFIKQRRNPTTKEIHQHWKDEGCGGTPDSDMSHLVKIGKLKRTPLGGKRGSRYLVA